MNTRQNIIHWSNLLYLLIVIVSLPITMGGNQPLPFGMDPALATIAAQVGLILVPALIFIGLARLPLRETLKLQPLSLKSMASCFLIGLVCWPLFVFLGSLVQVLIALIQPATTNVPTTIVSQGSSAWLILLGVGLVAPLCEEMLFRGVLLSVYEKRFAASAPWLVGVLFAFLHPSLEQAAGAFLVGAVAGWAVYRTRSIWAGLLIHIGTNLLAALLALAIAAAPGGGEATPPTGEAAALVWIGVLVWGVISLVMLVPGFFLLRGIARRYAAPAPWRGPAAPEPLQAPAPAWPESSGPARTQPGKKALTPTFVGLWSFLADTIAVTVFSVYRLLQGPF